MYKQFDHLSFLHMLLLSFTYQIMALIYCIALDELNDHQSITITIIIISLLIFVAYLLLTRIQKGSQYFLLKKIILRAILLIVILFQAPFGSSQNGNTLSTELKFLMIGRFLMKYCKYQASHNGVSLIYILFIVAMLHFQNLDLFNGSPVIVSLSCAFLLIFLIAYYVIGYLKLEHRQKDTGDTNTPRENLLHCLNKPSSSGRKACSDSNKNDKQSYDKSPQQILEIIEQNDEESKIPLPAQEDVPQCKTPQHSSSGHVVFYESILKHYPDGIIIYEQGEQMIFASQSKMKMISQTIMRLKNCQKEFAMQTKLHKAYQCLTTKLNLTKSQAVEFDLDVSLLDEEEEQDQEAEKNEIAIDYECFVSESDTIGQEYKKIITKVSQEMFDLEELHLDQIKFLFEVKMICSSDGTLNSYEKIQTLTCNTSKNPSLFQVTQKPFLYNLKPYVLMIIKDVTHFNQIRVLQSMNQNKSQMLSQVSHEFRTPLNCIILLVQTLMEQSQEEIKKDFLNPIYTSAKQLLSLINDLLDLAQLKAGKFKLVFEEFDIRQLLQDLYTLLHPNVTSKNNTLKIEIKATLSKIISDANRIRQILLNLVSNANKYTSNGNITISATQLKQSTNYNCIELAVEDTGYGIEKDDQQKLFQAFGKLERGKELNTQGVGLGLMISNILAERLGEVDEFFNSSDNELQAGLKVFSEGQNKGSRFSFIVIDQKDNALSSKYYQGSKGGSERMNSLVKRKLKSPEEQQRKKSFQISRVEDQLQNLSPIQHMRSVVFEKPYQHNGKESVECVMAECDTSPQQLKSTVCSCPEILIVDDEIFNIMALKQAVKKYNFKMDTAENGMVALEKVKKFQKCDDCHKQCSNYKIILMDMEMPIMNGLETVKKIRDLPMTQDIYIIGCSGHGEKAIQSCLEAGMNDYLQKPLKIGKFLEIVSSIQNGGNI